MRGKALLLTVVGTLGVVVAASAAGLPARSADGAGETRYLVLMIVYAWLSLSWLQTFQLMGETGDFSLSPTINWNYVILGWALALLISFEIVSHLRAIRQGLTRNVSRLATRLVMLILMLIMLSITVQKWDLFLDE